MGTANKHSFKKGYDAKRYVPINNGLIEYHSKLSELMRVKSLEAVDFIYETMKNDKASLVLRLKAANDILDRGLGKPVDRTVIATLDAGTAQADPSKLSDQDLLNLVSKSIDKHSIIDGEFQAIENKED
jgi:hypothetical protein